MERNSMAVGADVQSQAAPGPRRPAFLITIDTEGDNLWSPQSEVTTHNAAFLPRFQSLCERHGFPPTYLTDFEMANDPAFQDFARDVLKRGAGEIGMHLHAWNTPPHAPLTEDDTKRMPYITDYPAEIVRRKCESMTRLLEDTFAVRPQSHRGGRWAFDSVVARVLLELGYHSDCSVTPHLDWSAPGGDSRVRAPDFRAFPDAPYFIDLQDVSKPGHSALLELPMTVLLRPPSVWRKLCCAVNGRAATRRAMLRPKKGNRSSLLWIADEVLRRGLPYAMFMLHSSELMSGGSSTFPTPASIERLYDDLEALFSANAERFEGMTLESYYQRRSAVHVA